MVPKSHSSSNIIDEKGKGKCKSVFEQMKYILMIPCLVLQLSMHVLMRVKCPVSLTPSHASVLLLGLLTLPEMPSSHFFV